MRLLISKNGHVTAVYNDSLLPLAKRLGGEKQIIRASEVEWQGDAWVATSCKTGEILASEETRQRALQKEVTAIESSLTTYA